MDTLRQREEDISTGMKAILVAADQQGIFDGLTDEHIDILIGLADGEAFPVLMTAALANEDTCGKLGRRLAQMPATE